MQALTLSESVLCIVSTSIYAIYPAEPLATRASNARRQFAEQLGRKRRKKSLESSAEGGVGGEKVEYWRRRRSGRAGGEEKTADVEGGGGEQLG